MFHNYLITALRNFTRHKLYSFINIAGLTVGLVCTIFIILFVHDQLSYDAFIPNTQNLYRVEFTGHLPGEAPVPMSRIAFPATQAMLEQIPEVKAQTRLLQRAVSIQLGIRAFPETMDIVDPNFLQVIELALISGSAASVLAEPDSVVISQSVARKYFGHADALGKVTTMNVESCDDASPQTYGKNCRTKGQPLIVRGVLRDLPHNTQLVADLMMPDTSDAAPISKELRTRWLQTSGWGYVRLAQGANIDTVLKETRALFDRSIDPMKQLNVRMRGSDLMSPRLTPFRDDHLSSDRYGPSMTPSGSWTIVYDFIAIGALILLVACFNFTNLATAQAMVRAKEISMRKVLGAKRRQLMVQFLGESVFTSLVALVLALALAEIFLPVLDRFAGMPIGSLYMGGWPVLLFTVGIALLTGVLSGAYPALVLSGFPPASALSTGAASLQGSGITRTLLVVLQFAVSIGLGIVALVIFAQVSFARGVDLGFQKGGIVVLNVANISPNTIKGLSDALRASPDIADTGISGEVPFDGANNNLVAHLPGSSITQAFGSWPINPAYMRTYGMHLIAGRFLSEQRSTDAVTNAQLLGRDKGLSTNILIDATAARRLGFTPRQALAKTLIVQDVPVPFVIAGVVGDVAQNGPRNLGEGAVYYYPKELPRSWLSIRIRAGRLRDGLSAIDRTWRAFAPGVAIQRHFLDDDYNKLFLADERQGTVFGIFVGVAIFIACLGLFGLAAFSTERRAKEIGLRKAFGARTGDIILLLLWQFSVPVLVANLIAWPIAYYYLRHWLDGYAYRIGLNPLYFVGAGLAALLIAWATVIVHAAHVARANPVHALRYE